MDYLSTGFKNMRVVSWLTVRTELAETSDEFEISTETENGGESRTRGESVLGFRAWGHLVGRHHREAIVPDEYRIGGDTVLANT